MVPAAFRGAPVPPRGTETNYSRSTNLLASLPYLRASRHPVLLAWKQQGCEAAVDGSSCTQSHSPRTQNGQASRGLRVFYPASVFGAAGAGASWKRKGRKAHQAGQKPQGHLY